jgi:Protein of unknown function, DUF481
MKIAAAVVFCALLVTMPGLAREKSDVLVMNNGDRLTCEIKGLDAGVLYVSFDYIKGTTEVNWLKVHHIESKQLFLVKTGPGNSYIGTLSTAETEEARPISIQVVDDQDHTTEVRRRDVVQIDQTDTNFWRRFNGEINSGLIFSKANSSTQYSLSSNITYPRERWSAGAGFTSSLTGNTGATTSTRNDGTAYYRHLMRWNNWFYTGVGSLLQSTEQDIALQSSIGGGIGRYVKNTNRARIAVYGGMAYQNTRYNQTVIDQSGRNTLAGLVGASAELFRFNKTNLTIATTVVPAFNTPGRVYTALNATYWIKFWSNLTWNVSFYGNWDNQPPATFSGSDYGTSTGLGWTFGNR